MTEEQINSYTDKIFAKVSNVPGIDKNVIRKCLIGISSLNDMEVENKIKQLMLFM